MKVQARSSSGRYGFEYDTVEKRIYGYYVNKKNELIFHGVTNNHRYFKKKVASHIKKIDGSTGSCYAITTSNKLYYYEMDGDKNCRATLVMKNVKDISTKAYGRYGFMALTKNGEAWLIKSKKVLGEAPRFTKKRKMKKVQKVYTTNSNGKGTFYMLKKDGSLWGFGDNSFGELANGTTTTVKNPIKIMDDVKTFYVDGGHFGMNNPGSTCYAIKKDESLYGWGMSDKDEIPGDLVYREMGSYETAVTVPIRIMDHVRSIDKGTCYVVAVKNDNTLWAWGGYAQSWSGLSANYEIVGSPVQIAEHVKKAETTMYKGTNIIYYIDTNDTLWAKCTDNMDAAAVLCLKKVKDIDKQNQVFLTKNGKLYYVTANHKSRHILLKKKLCSGL